MVARLPSNTHQKMFRLIIITGDILFLAALASAQGLHTPPINLSGQERLYRSQAKAGSVSLTLWVGARDFVAPRSGEVAGRIANFLASQGVRFTFFQERFEDNRASDLNTKHHLVLARLGPGAFFESLRTMAARLSLHSRLEHKVLMAVSPGTLD